MKHRTSLGGLALIQENLTGEAIPAEEVIDLDNVSGDGADAALLGFQEAASEEAANEATIGDLENSAISLESLLEQVEPTLETGGLDPVAAQLLTTAVENETAPLNTPASEVVPALENFNSAAGRVRYTQVTCESLRETIAKIWAKIKEYIQKGRELAKKTIVAAKQAFVGLDRRIASLEEAAKKANYSMPKSEQIELSSDTWVATAPMLKKTKEMIADILKEEPTVLIGNAGKVASGLRSGDAAKIAEAAQAGLDAVKRTGNASGLVGGRSLVTRDGGTPVINITENKAGAYKGAVLKEAEAKAIIAELKEISAMVVAYEKNFLALDKAKDDLSKAGDEFSKKQKDDDATGANAAQTRQVLNHVRELTDRFDQPAKDVVKYAVALVKGVSDYVAANLKAYDRSGKKDGEAGGAAE